MPRIKQNDYTPKLGVVAQPRDVISTTPLTPMRTADIAGAFSDVLPSLMQARKEYNDGRIDYFKNKLMRGEQLTEDEEKDRRAIQAIDQIQAMKDMASLDAKLGEAASKANGDMQAYEKQVEQIRDGLKGRSDAYIESFGPLFIQKTGQYRSKVMSDGRKIAYKTAVEDSQNAFDSLYQADFQTTTGFTVEQATSSPRAYTQSLKELDASMGPIVRSNLSAIQRALGDASFDGFTKNDTTQAILNNLDSYADRGLLPRDIFDIPDEAGQTLRTILGPDKTNDLLLKNQQRRKTMLNSLVVARNDQLQKVIDDASQFAMEVALDPDKTLNAINSKRREQGEPELTKADLFALARTRADQAYGLAGSEWKDYKKVGDILEEAETKGFAREDDSTVVSIIHDSMDIEKITNPVELLNYKSSLTEQTFAHLHQMWSDRWKTVNDPSFKTSVARINNVFDNQIARVVEKSRFDKALPHGLTSIVQDEMEETRQLAMEEVKQFLVPRWNDLSQAERLEEVNKVISKYGDKAVDAASSVQKLLQDKPDSMRSAQVRKQFDPMQSEMREDLTAMKDEAFQKDFDENIVVPEGKVIPKAELERIQRAWEKDPTILQRIKYQ